MATAPAKYSAADFFLEDFPRTLFPLSTNKVLVEHGATELLSFAENIIAGSGSFLPQRRVYANKDPLHLRRTVKLDAVAEFFLYHLVLKNRAHFRKPHTEARQHFGYRFQKGSPVAPSKSYGDFKRHIAINTLARITRNEEVGSKLLIRLFRKRVGHEQANRGHSSKSLSFSTEIGAPAGPRATDGEATKAKGMKPAGNICRLVEKVR